jgi:hypothetical protein
MDEPAKPWAHLPNAAHIDRVLANSKENPAEWVAARGAAWGAAWSAAWGAAWDAARDAARDAAWSAAWDAARDAAWGAARGDDLDTARDAAWDAARDATRGAAWDAVAALLAWNDCAYLLDLPPEALRAIIRMDSGAGKHQAVLLLPASIVFNGGSKQWTNRPNPGHTYPTQRA